jgi:hypothetical protein
MTRRWMRLFSASLDERPHAPLAERLRNLDDAPVEDAQCHCQGIEAGRQAVRIDQRRALRIYLLHVLHPDLQNPKTSQPAKASCKIAAKHQITRAMSLYRRAAIRWR